MLFRPWISFACWCLLAGGAAVEAAASSNNDTGVLNMDMIFPRNETYSSRAVMPLVFGLQNAHLAQHISASITYDVWRVGTNFTRYTHSIASANFSANQLLSFTYLASEFKTEGQWVIQWGLQYASCSAKPHTNLPEIEYYPQTDYHRVWFTIKNSSQEVDLPAELAAANEHDSCFKSDGGVVIEVTSLLEDKLTPPPEDPLCAVVASKVPRSDPCAIKLDAAAISTITYRSENDGCYPGSHLHTSPFSNQTRACIQDESGAQRSTVGGVALLVAVFGGLATFGGMGFLL